MEIRCKYQKLVPIEALVPHSKNANRHPPEQIKRLAAIIDYQGMRHPIVVSKRSGLVVAGHGRLEALRVLNVKEAPVDFQDFDTDEQEIAFLHSDNAIALWAEIDLGAINQQLEELGPDFDLEMLGLKNFNLDFDPSSLLNPESPEEKTFTFEPKLEIKCKNEDEQKQLFDELKERGHEVRILS